MLTRLLNTNQIDITDPEISSELESDLLRMNEMEHNDAPVGATTYKVTVKPHKSTYSSSLHRFQYDIQYGDMENGEFVPQGDPIQRFTETLPMLM